MKQKNTYGAYKKRRREKLLGLKLVEGVELVGAYKMPKLKPITAIPSAEVIPFCLLSRGRKTAELNKSAPIFYLEDPKFECVWNRPKVYLRMLQHCAYCFGPDFSVYLDMPLALQIWNCWRNQILTCYWQNHGVIVIPNASWSDQDSYEWAFAGLPENSYLSVTSQGCMTDAFCKASFVNGLHELIRRKHPLKVFVYGSFPEKWRDKFGTEIVRIPAYAEKKWRAA